MTYRYSDYSIEQLRAEVEQLKKKAHEAESMGKISQVAINERKIQIVLSYMLHPDDFSSNDIHELKGDPGHTFKINYINGVMAWGHKVNLLGELYEEEEALPLAMLGDKITKV